MTGKADGDSGVCNSSGGDSHSDVAAKCRPAALSEEDFNHLLEIRKRKSDEMDDGGDNASS